MKTFARASARMQITHYACSKKKFKSHCVNTTVNALGNISPPVTFDGTF